MLVDLENQIDATRDAVKELPLSFYEEHYLSANEGYKDLLSNYSGKKEGQFVALGMYYGMHNPEFSARMAKNATLKDKLQELKTAIPDTRLNIIISNLIDMKVNQAELLISHRLNPENSKARASWLMSKINTEHKIEQGIRTIRKQLDSRLLELWNGAKYEH